MYKIKKDSKYLVILLGLLLVVYLNIFEMFGIFNKSLLLNLLIIGGVLFYSYNRKTKKLKPFNTFIAVVMSFILLSPLKNIAINIGSKLYSPHPLFIFILLLSIFYLIIESYKKYKKLTNNTLLVIFLFVFVLLKDRLIEPLGNLIYIPYPFFGYFLFFAISYLVFINFIKFKKLTESSILYIFMFILFIIINKFDLLIKIDNIVLSRVSSSQPRIIWLSILLVILNIIYWLKYKNKKENKPIKLQ